MMAESEEKLTKVWVDLPNHWACGGESMWASPLGDNLYELRNVPFYAYDLNYGDVVRTVAESPEHKTEIQKVVRRSGHETLRIVFMDGSTVTQRTGILDRLTEIGCSWEGANESFYALDLSPETDIDAVRDYLETFSEDVVGYETCEACVEGSFDAAPEVDLI